MDEVTTPRPIKPERELDSFFDSMFGVQSGYCYIATKHPTELDSKNRNLWVQHFFKWPDQKAELITSVVTSMAEWEVYFSPALFKEPKATKESFKGTYHLWTEFDGTLPEELGDIPEPSIKIQSSEAGHEHWYWRLSYWEDNQETLEKLTRPLAYALGADLSVWNANRVLRPPATIHHESNKITFFLKNSSESVSLEAFTRIPQPASKLVAVDSIGEIPDWQKVVYGYQWPEAASELFRRPSFDKGNTRLLANGERNKGRSSALTALAFHCAEMGMQNEEIFSVIQKADDKWKKFAHRPDRAEKLIAIVNYVRSKKPQTESKGADKAKVWGVLDLINADVTLDWLVSGLVERQGIGIISGPPGLGKTQFSLQLCISLALGRKYLAWDVEQPIKSMFFSLEMGHAALNEVLRPMFTAPVVTELDDDGRELLNENMRIIPINQSLNLTTEANQAILAADVEDHKPDVLFIDNLGSAILKDLIDDTVINQVFNFAKILNNQYNTTVVFLHHNRKPQAARNKPRYLSDVYGSQFIAGNATNVTGLWRNEDAPPTAPIEINCLKMRVAANWPGFKVKRDPETLWFKEVNPNLNKMGFDFDEEEEINDKQQPAKKDVSDDI